MRFPQRRAWAATIFGQWADRDHLQRIWVDHSADGLDLYSQLGFLYDDWEVLPTVDSDIGDLVANRTEADRFEALGSALEELIGSASFAWNNARSFLDTPQWGQIAARSASCLRLLVLDGHCWEIDEPSPDEDRAKGEGSGLVRDVPGRAIAAQCLAAIAEGSMGDRPAPFWRSSQDAIDELMTRCGLAEPEAHLGTVYADGRDEVARMLELRTAITADGSGVASRGGPAERALWSMVGNGAGWNWDERTAPWPGSGVS